MSRQLALSLPVREARGREDFFVSPANATALAQLDDWQNWPGGKLVLRGPSASGKSHLAEVWAEAAGAGIVAASELDDTEIADLAQGPVVVEDVDRGPIDEAALFHLHNILAEGRHPLLLTGTGRVSDWGIALPDLKSRIGAAGVATLSAPDDALLGVVLLKQFSDRQIAVSPNLIEFILPRIDRSFAAARDIVTRLDKLALAEKRPITRRLAARVLDTDRPEDP